MVRLRGRAGKVVRFWASTEVIHLCIGGGRVKSVHSHLSVADLAKLVADGAVNAGPAPIPTLGDGQTVEVDRVVAPGGTVCLAGRQYVAAALLAGRQVGIRIEPATLLFFDLDTRELLRTRPNPLTPSRSSGCAAPDLPGHHHGPDSSRSGCNATPTVRAR